jgi:hypothetical protein
VVKGILGEGYAFDAVAVGSYAHRFRQLWTNLIPTTLLHSMVEKQFASRSPDQSVQDILEPDRKCDDCARLSLTGTLDSKDIARGYASYRISSFFTTHPV